MSSSSSELKCPNGNGTSDCSGLATPGVEKVPIWRKLAYAVGAMPYAMCTTIIGLYFGIFLLEVVLVSFSS